SYNDTEHSLIYEDILDAFNDNLSSNPESTLVSYMDVSYSYGECAFIADKISRKLIDLGVESGDCVGFLVPRSELYMFSVLGIMSAGAVYVPLDDNLPDNRIKFILNDTESKVIIASDETYNRVRNLSYDAIILNLSDIIEGRIGELSHLSVDYCDLACILYTSGTTGVPKGVKITRKSIVNVVSSYVDSYGLSTSDVYGLFASIGFDAANFAINAVMYAGASLSVVPQDIRLNMLELNRYFVENNVTHSFITTQAGKLFVLSIEDTSLDVLLVGGEKLGEFESPGDYTFVDIYGPTEAFTYISLINNDDKIDYSSVGSWNKNIKCYIVDDEFRRVPVGAVGELCLAGYQIADGYLNREEETKEAFIVNPFDDDAEYNVLYRTGDMARILSDGSLSIVGRRDSQVKIRGNRVELSEVEAVIRELDYVDDVTVQTIRHDDNYELVAYVVSGEFDGDTLRNKVCEFVSEFKPDYMVPSHVINLDSIPLNVNGKVDKRALPDVDFTDLRAEYVAPSTEAEKIIAKTFEKVFNQDRIGLYDDFVRLGGDSIVAIRVVSLLEKESLFATAKDILNFKTPYLIAQNIKIRDRISYDSTVGEVSMLPIQSYFFDQINEDNFTQQFVLKAKEDIDIGILQDAFDELSDIHDMLRASYRFEDDGVVQSILPLRTRVCEIKKYVADDLDYSINRVIKESRDSINTCGDLIKASIVLNADECYVIFVIHHLIVDGVSWNIILEDLTHIYNSMIKNESIDFLRPYPYKLWVNDVKYLVDCISDEERQDWYEINGLLDDSQIKGESRSFIFDMDVSFSRDNLFRLSEEEYLTLCIARAYKKTYGEDIILNHETHGRDDDLARVNRTVGWFTSQYPLRICVGNDYEGISLMNDVLAVKSALNSVEHFGLNYESLIYYNKELEYKHCPVTFNFLSSEFEFNNDLFESSNHAIFDDDDVVGEDNHDSYSYGVSLNFAIVDGLYVVSGNYADGTFIGDKFSDFINNIKDEMSFISDYGFENGVICCLSEPQLGIYLDEKVHDKGTAYSAPGIFYFDEDKTVGEVENAIRVLIDKHPILKGRVYDNGGEPLLICDNDPLVEICDVEDHYDLIEPFDLEKSLSRFYIVSNDNDHYIFYDIHHIISDATTRSIINRKLDEILNGNVDLDVDLGFVRAGIESFESKFGDNYHSAHDYFSALFADIDECGTLLNDVDGSAGRISLPIRGIRNNVESFVHKNNITVSILLNAVFSYTCSRFSGSNKVYYNFTEHGRHDDYAQNALGMFIRTIPVLVDCENKDISDYLNDVSDLILKSMTNSIYPFRLLAREFNLNNNVVFEYNYDLN
ncbi:condensation domain-containing protein, partial [Methanobrevibacter sp.]|uniref:non-ribosomal peptide synthetase n=1 Tax=Methanobrevibacter sp. TaxID=66852 RepID=UPI00388FBD4D